MSRPELYDVTLLSHHGPVRLCRCCFSVMVNEGVVAGDPTLPGCVANVMTQAWPVFGVKLPCAACEALRRFEERRALLGAPPQRTGDVKLASGLYITAEAKQALEEAE